MPNRDTNTHNMSLVDIPLVKRLSAQGMVLNSEMGLTRDARGPNSALLSSILFPQRGFHTLVARSDEQQVVGQYRTWSDDPNAHIVYIAPRLDEHADDTAWLHILDAMAREAGKHDAHSLVAEVEESSHLFETMRTAGFAVYTRQEIWRRDAGLPIVNDENITLSEETERDATGIYSLFCSTIPSMVQQVAVPPGDMRGLVYRNDDRIEGYLAISEGKDGIYLIPYLHQDITEDVAAIIEAAVAQTQRATRVPVYVCVRRYQNWVSHALQRIQFTRWVLQAVMVKHLAAGVRHAGFAPVKIRWAHKKATSPLTPPGNMSQSINQE